MALVPNPRDIADLLKTITTRESDAFQRRARAVHRPVESSEGEERYVDFSSIRASFSGAAPLMAATKSGFEDLTGEAWRPWKAIP